MCQSAAASVDPAPSVAAAEATGSVEWLIVEFDHIDGSAVDGVPREPREPGRARAGPRALFVRVDARRPGSAIVGCGNVTRLYLTGTAMFPSIELAACADLDRGRARRSQRRAASGRRPSTAPRRPDDRGRPGPDAACRPRARGDGRDRGRQARLLGEAARDDRGRCADGARSGRRGGCARRRRAGHVPRWWPADGAGAHR